MKLEIMSISNLLHLNYLYSSPKIAIIFVTTKLNYFNFGSTHFIHLNIAAVGVPTISLRDRMKLRDFLFFAEDFDTIYVCCDAGLSRSPAVAKFIAYKLGDREQEEEIDKKYKHKNKSLLKVLLYE